MHFPSCTRKHCLLRTSLGTGEADAVTVCTLYSLKILRDLISMTVSSPTRPSGEQPRKGNFGFTHNPDERTFLPVSFSYLRMAFASLLRPYSIQNDWKGSESIPQILWEMNLKTSTGALGFFWTINFPNLYAGRHFDAVKRHQRSLNHRSELLWPSVPGISMRWAVVRFSHRMFTFWCKVLGSPRS